MNVDLVVVGSGEAAQGVVFRMRAAGWSVAVVDSRPFGGTCSWRGCDPKKVLVGVAELVDWGRRMQGSGISAPAPTLAWSDMITFKRTIIESVSADVETGFREAGITRCTAAPTSSARQRSPSARRRSPPVTWSSPAARATPPSASPARSI
jgi:pyruvate/2-oxoglutarate dehydrogenase complex dihydrolipoamide dehydrogenase (E3) component